MFRKSLVFAGAVCLGMIMSTSASAGNNKDRLVVTGLTDANGFTSTLNGNPALDSPPTMSAPVSRSEGEVVILPDAAGAWGWILTRTVKAAYPKSSRISLRRATASRSARLAGSEGAS
jgi:hypothetical protein